MPCVGTQYASFRDKYYVISLAYLSVAVDQGQQVVTDADSSTNTPLVDRSAAVDLAAPTSTPLQNVGARVSTPLPVPLTFVYVSVTQREARFAV